MKLKKNIKRIPRLYLFLIGLKNSWKKGCLRRIIHYIANGHFVKKSRVKSFLNQDKKFFQVGGGEHLIKDQNWLNADIVAGDIYLNATNKLPFPDNSIDAIFTEQFIEHLSQYDAINFTQECFRVLKPNGILRQSTPSLDKIVLIYNGANPIVSISEVMQRHIKNHRRNDDYILNNACQFMNDMFRLWSHQFIYDEATLIKIHLNAGFEKVKLQEFGISDYENLANLEKHFDIEWMKNGFTLIVESKKVV